jgi:iron complex outermembrane receptor protein
VYANWGQGFETPTLAEAAYTVQNSVIKSLFNSNLLASRSQHSEVGLKWTPTPATRIDAALFHIGTDNEIVTLLSSGGKTAYKNAAKTQREGAELALKNDWTAQWRTQLSMAWLRAVYASDFTSGTNAITSGKSMPGIPAQQLFAALQWADQGFASKTNLRPLGWSASADWVARSHFWADDLNSADAHVAGFGQVNLRVRHRQLWGPVRAELWAGVDNVMDKKTVGSVIVNQAAKQYFEPSLPRNAILGASLSLPL